MDQGTKSKRRVTKGAGGRWEDVESCRKKREAVGRQKDGDEGEPAKRDLRDWSEDATEQRPKGPTKAGRRSSGAEAKGHRTESEGTGEERVQGDHSGAAASARTKGSKGIKRRKPIKGANGPRSEAVETLPEANQRGESVVSGETDSRSQSKGRKSISQGVTGS